MNTFKKIITTLILFFIFLLPLKKINAASDAKVSNIYGRVINIIEEKEIVIMDNPQLYQKIEIELSKKDAQKIIVESGVEPLANNPKYKVNDNVVLNIVKDLNGKERYIIVDFVRNDSLILLLIIFVALLVLIAKWKGLMSLIAMMFTFLMIFSFVLPQILKGFNPVLIATVAALIIVPVSFYIAHGINKKTTIAIISSLISLIITAILASVFTEIGHLSGLSSEEAGMLSIDNQNLNMKGILLAGIVIGALGVLDDITISQAAIVDELTTTAKLKKAQELYSRAMIIGKDHISSMVNTLILAYSGAALPLLLIFTNNPHPFLEIVNYEMIAEEIIRTLVGSIGLILAVPITTFIAAYCYKNK